MCLSCHHLPSEGKEYASREEIDSKLEKNVSSNLYFIIIDLSMARDFAD